MLMLLLVGTGGHLAQMFAMRDWSQHHERLWATLDPSDATVQLRGAAGVHHPTTRRLPNEHRKLWLRVRVRLGLPPDVVITGDRADGRSGTRDHVPGGPSLATISARHVNGSQIAAGEMVASRSVTFSEAVEQ